MYLSFSALSFCNSFFLLQYIAFCLLFFAVFNTLHFLFGSYQKQDSRRSTSWQCEFFDLSSNQEAEIFWEKGVKVLIQGGKYKNRNGVIIKVTTKMVKVDIVGLGEKYVKKENICKAVIFWEKGVKVLIQGGKYKNRIF